MNWTTETPAVEGYYWIRDDENDTRPDIVKIEEFAGAMMSYAFGSEVSEPIEYHLGALWYGPIEPPAFEE